MERSYKIPEEFALEVFSSQAYLAINKKLLAYFGPDIALFLSNLIDKYRYLKEKDKVLDGDWFFVTHEQQIAQTGLTLTKIRSCKEELKNQNILFTSMRGVPAKEHYRIYFGKLIQVITDEFPSPQDSLEQDVDTTRRQDVDTTTQLYINKDSQIYRDQNTKKIIPPKIEWVIQYCNDRKNTVDPNQWFDFYTSKGWKIGKYRMKDWQAAVRTWERNRIEENTCPNIELGWVFGKSWNPKKSGCINCEEDNPKLYQKCKLLCLKDKSL